MTLQEKSRLEEIIGNLDKDKINESLHLNAPSFFSLDEYDLLADMCLKALDIWLLDDIDSLEITAVEVKKEVILPGAIDPIHFICDIEAIEKSTGKRIVCDWKTSAGELDVRWEQRKQDSFQWRTYLAILDAESLQYRGVSNRLKTRTVTVNTYPSLHDEVQLIYTQVSNMRASLIGTQPWPRNMPGSCMAFGRQCSYLKDCRTRNYPKDILIPKSISPSALDNFLLCPERHRRDELIKINRPEGTVEQDAASNYQREIGSAFHKGISEIYKQIFHL